MNKDDYTVNNDAFLVWKFGQQPNVAKLQNEFDFKLLPSKNGYLK